MKVLLEQNGGPNGKEVPYFAVVEMPSISADKDHAFRVPIYLTKNGTSKYNAEVCGFRVEGHKPDEVESYVEKLIPGLVNMARLPTYVFIARRSHQMYPVYTVGDEVFVTTPGGPLFRHVELAKIRDYLTDYLHTIGELGVPGKSEKLHVRGVHRISLGLVRPVFYLKKRAENGGDNEFWGPVFPSMTSDAIYIYAASGRREVELDNGYEVFQLRHQVALALIADKRLKDESDLRADRLLPEYFEKVKQNLTPLSSKLITDGMEMPVFKARSKVVAVEYRAAEDRYSFYVGTDLQELRMRSAKDLVRRGLVSKLDDVELVG